MDLSDVDNEDTRWTHEQLAEFPDGAFGSDGVYHTCEQWDQHKGRFKRDEVDVQNNDDEEVHRLIESEAEALATLSQTNKTLTHTTARQ